MTDLKSITDAGYTEVRELATGEIAGLQRMLFTVGLFVGLDETGYRTRFCYPDFISAYAALVIWDGRGDPPGPWIKEKPADRSASNSRGERAIRCQPTP